jgi:sorting nexin-1/2
VTSPHKVGEGMSSYVAYKVVTRTNSNYFKKKEMAVTRRFSDFLGLHDKLGEKYRPNGRIIPPAPDKSVVGMTKVKMSKDNDEAQDEVKTIQKLVF